MAGKSKPREPGQFLAETPELLGLAALIKELFLSTRERWAPGSGGVSQSKKSVFVQAARRCRALEVSPEVFVDQRFQAALQSRAKLFPEILVSDSLDKTVETLVAPVADDNVLDRLTFQFAEFERRRHLYSAASILKDRTVDLTPLFRYCMATRHHLPAIAERFREDARRELASCPIAGKVFVEEIKTL